MSIERDMRNGKYLITARAEPDPWNKLILLEGRKLVEDVREETVGKGKDRRKVLTASIATKTRGGSVQRR